MSPRVFAVECQMFERCASILEGAKHVGKPSVFITVPIHRIDHFIWNSRQKCDENLILIIGIIFLDETPVLPVTMPDKFLTKGLDLNQNSTMGSAYKPYSEAG
jgi:hypothetical protein